MSRLEAEEARDPDARLLTRFRRRDPEALGLVFDRFAPKVHAFLSRVEDDPDEVDRLVEEVFWAVWVAAARPGGEADVERMLRQALGSCLRGRHARRTR